MRISDWSSHVCSSDLYLVERLNPLDPNYTQWLGNAQGVFGDAMTPLAVLYQQVQRQATMLAFLDVFHVLMIVVLVVAPVALLMRSPRRGGRSEEHTSELQSLMRISYAVFCLKTS